MPDISYECDEHGIISGQVTDGVRVINFTLTTDTLMHAKDQGLHLLDEVITAAIKELNDHPEEINLDVVQSATMPRTTRPNSLA